MIELLKDQYENLSNFVILLDDISEAIKLMENISRDIVMSADVLKKINTTGKKLNEKDDYDNSVKTNFLNEYINSKNIKRKIMNDKLNLMKEKYAKIKELIAEREKSIKI